ncbi:LysR family transcriptional regulator [Kitasatospora paracochleata]|uniref:DNA-binding transcriptional LysR family regulator n=1 Tax=Kitasatospora paracochleata TaxID=58354 RepID=A0ABT1J586_9ACTN|nr:LysR family transcriptional regulator [Kitasatospora paracochleata]MCP2312602.1 DNA-binding transcriptional LysR family regulator [Kitasatospora paracochleata]
MDPQQLRTLTAVVRLGSFSEAARELGYTQSAVSQQVAALEADLGTVLLERRPVRTTEAGERLLEHAGPLLLRLDAARADVRRLAAAPTARLLIGAAGASVTPRLAHALAEVRSAYPRLDLTIDQVARADITAQVATGALDLGLVDGVAAPSDPLALPDAGPLVTVAVAEEPLAVALPAAHPLARRPGLALADLADARWLDAPDVAMDLDRLRTVAGTDGFRAAARYRGGEVRGLLALVAAGHGLALLPATAAAGAADVAAVPLRSPRLVHRTELVHGSLPDGPAALLVRLLDGGRPDGLSVGPSAGRSAGFSPLAG